MDLIINNRNNLQACLEGHYGNDKQRQKNMNIMNMPGHLVSSTRHDYHIQFVFWCVKSCENDIS